MARGLQFADDEKRNERIIAYLLCLRYKLQVTELDVVNTWLRYSFVASKNLKIWTIMMISILTINSVAVWAWSNNDDNAMLISESSLNPTKRRELGFYSIRSCISMWPFVRPSDRPTIDPSIFLSVCLSVSVRPSGPTNKWADRRTEQERGFWKQIKKDGAIFFHILT